MTVLSFMGQHMARRRCASKLAPANLLLVQANQSSRLSFCDLKTVDALAQMANVLAQRGHAALKA